MTGCTIENWTLESLASALQNMHKDNKKIAVPMFQRGKRWNRQQQSKFIDSLINGFPVGTMLFYETFENAQQTYILVDGLQRGNSIKKYMNNPTEFFYDRSISEEFCQSVLAIVNANTPQNYDTVRSILTEFIKEQKSFKNLQYYQPAKTISDHFNAGSAPIGKLIEVIAAFFEDRQALYDQIASTMIPVIVYHGDEENLPEIFDRINSQGTPLDQYEVYAAAWPVNNRFRVSNTEIIECAIKKYDSFVEDGFVIHGYDREQMRSTKEINAFEYLFGLSKYLVSKFDILGFQKNLPDDTVNPLAFELVNACLNDTDKIKVLYHSIYSIPDKDAFEAALCCAIDFVTNAISAITRFKGNSRSQTKLYHSKYQILSMVSTTFKEMFTGSDYSRTDEEWAFKKDSLAKNLRLYYVYDIITNYWSEGGSHKIHSAAKPNRYATEITPRMWRNALDSFFDKSMLRTESKQIPNPRSEEYVILNCIYLNTFTAMDQLSIDRFDVEHIAPKEQMKRFISATGGVGLPISCIANLCYLPESVNRSKRDRNFYQDTKYLQQIDLAEVERKYSFTTNNDLEWMDMEYSSTDDFEALKEFYGDFCISRFEIMKKKFCKSMGIDYDAVASTSDDPHNVIAPSVGETPASPANNYVASYVTLVETKMGITLNKISQNIYKSSDEKVGFVFSVSKTYHQGTRVKYWYAYRHEPLKKIADCEKIFIVYGFKDSTDALLIPLDIMEKNINSCNYSTYGEDLISHWHIVFFRDENDHLTQLFSHPDVREVDMDEYRIH